MSDNPVNNVIDGAAPLDEELVAYLDGELDAESGRRIEALLASDPAVRRRLQSLERTWDLLDELDAAPLGEPFTQTTLEMVAVAARQEVEKSRAEAPRRRRRWLLGVGAGLLAAIAAGFLAVALHNPDRQLLQNLPLLENLDEYRQIGSIDFLHRLRDEKFPFATSAKPSASAEESIAARRQRVEGMGLDAKEQLLRGEDRFAASPPAEQQRLRRLYEDLRDDPDSKRLRAIMHAYYEWLRPLPAVTWAELAEGETEERIALVKKHVHEEEQRDGGWRPDAKDLAALRSWMDDCAARHEADFVKSLPTDKDRKQFSDRDKAIRHQMMVGFLHWQWQILTPGKLPPLMTTEDLARLREKLSPEARKQLESKKPVQQWRMAATWMRQGFRRAFEERRLRGPLSQDDDERLEEFFEKLSDAERDRLLAMPGEQMQWELQRLFLTRNRPPQGPGRRNRRPGEPEWPGPGWPGPGPRFPPPNQE
jgi:hypothetical protein